MSRRAKLSRPSRIPPDALAWIAALNRGYETGDFALIQRANSELEKLGVEIALFEPPARAARGNRELPPKGKP